MILDDTPNAPDSDEQQLLQQLITEGLAPSTADQDSHDGLRYRKLLQVLFQACIISPALSTEVPSASVIEQAGYTLTILERQMTSRSELVLSSPSSDQKRLPFYKWVIPRLIHAASRLDGRPQCGGLVSQLCASVGTVLRALARHAEDEDGTYAKGVHRAVTVARQLVRFCQDAMAGKKPILFGYSEMKPDLSSALHILGTLVDSSLAFTDDVLIHVAAASADISRLLPRCSPTQQLRQANTVASALTSAPSRSAWMSSISACLDLQPSNDDSLGRLTSRVLDSCKTLDGPLRAAIWWHLAAASDEVEAYAEAGHAKAAFLLSCPPDRLARDVLNTVLSEALVDRWIAQARGLSGQHAATLRNTWTALRDGQIDEPPSKKRRRADHELNGRTKAYLARHLPGLAFSAGSVSELVQELRRHAKDPQTEAFAQIGAILGGLCCEICECENHQSPPTHPLPDTLLALWTDVQSRSPAPATAKDFRTLAALLDHTSPIHAAAALQLGQRNVPVMIESGMRVSDRKKRVAASLVFVRIFALQYKHPDPATGAANRESYLSRLTALLGQSITLAETATAILGQIGKHADEADLRRILHLLLEQLGASHAPLRSMSFTELGGLCQARGKTPYTLVSPFLESISIFLAQRVCNSPELVVETMQFIGSSRQNFFEMTLRFTIPALVLDSKREELRAIAGFVNKNLGAILIDNVAGILAKIFLHSERPERHLNFLSGLLRQLTSNKNTQMEISVASLMTSCIVSFLFALIVELGDEAPRVQKQADRALRKAQIHSGGVASDDLGAFLKPHMLGVISHLNETLHDIQGRKSAAYKCKVIRSLGALIRLVGDSMSSFSPQIVASLQSTLTIPELRKETLRTWERFVTTLRFADLGPYVGRTAGVLVINWPNFDDAEKVLATNIMNNIADNVRYFDGFQDEIVSLEKIPELKHAARKLTIHRQNWDIHDRIDKLLDRTRSKNIAVATTSMAELRDVLVSRQVEIRNLARGDMFEDILARLIRSVMSAATRDGECDDLRGFAYECLGILGALDPDRLPALPEPHSMTIMSNFADKGEATEFAIHLIRDLLVDAFHATNDTKHQNHLAYAIQELLRFSGFNSKILSNPASLGRDVMQRWTAIPKDQYETLTPLLESRFTLSETQNRVYDHPIYPAAPTYREWIQRWTADLISKVESFQNPQKGLENSKLVFRVFRGVLRNQDVTVAHHILPHLVLHVLLSGCASDSAEICGEVNTVLQDQMNPAGSADKRTFSAQVIFELMDHLSKWLRLQRTRSKDQKSRAENSQAKAVEAVLASIETELMANAALQSRAYARSLRSFEQRVIELRREDRSIADLQTYFERMHQIYAELDEPDGMEGVSAFVLSPSLELQIREHESTGRWTSAQSCWEVRLQQSPDDVTLHEGLLRCLKSLGHYDTLRTHIRGVLSKHPQWSDRLSAYEAEAAWIIGDWETVEHLGDCAPAVGKVLDTVHRRGDLPKVLGWARQQIGGEIKNVQYSRAYDAVMRLHQLREIEMIHQSDIKALQSASASSHKGVITQSQIEDLRNTLKDRYNTSSPSFRNREMLLSIRRTAFSLVNAGPLREELGQAWIQTSKIARKAGYDQTAYSAALQAREVDAPFAFVQQAKLLHAHGSTYKALSDLENSVAPLQKQASKDTTPDFARDRALAKAVLLEARWADETTRFERNDILQRFLQAIQLAQNLESPYYHLGHYYDTMLGDEKTVAQYNYHTCHNYIQALLHGVKYIYQTMPRMLTIWLDLGESKAAIRSVPEVADSLHKITKLADSARKQLMTYQFLTAFPQIVSRIGHSNKDVAAVLKKIMALVISRFPQQALWPTVGVMQSNRAERKALCDVVIKRAITDVNTIAPLCHTAAQLSAILLKLADDKSESKKREASISIKYPYVQQAFSGTVRMIMPLQDALVCPLPAPGEDIQTHRPFPSQPVLMKGIDDAVDIMPSLQRPKKLTFVGSDGKYYPFLCKPHDDLRKDARLMDFNSMINKFLKSASESRRRQLYVRTYAVTPLNEECGLIEWVSNTNALKSILEKGYLRRGVKVYTTEMHKLLEQAKQDGPGAQIKAFRDQIIPMFRPTVFVDWFLATWPEPSAWLASRMAYARTLAVMSMIGYVLGLGDRHGENILFDGLSGDTVHVDLNCLFDKGKLFEIPERVPFRLTQNMGDALGVTGVEGVFRKAAEISLGILRANSEALMSVLEAFAHDPLVEWTRTSHKAKGERDPRAIADRNLRPIRAKLKGIMEDNVVKSVPSQVDILIKEATKISNLALMYQGWAAWL